MLLRGVDPALVDFQPGDRSRLTAPRRAISVQRGLRGNQRIPPVLLRKKPGGRYEVWDGNARVFAYKELDRPFDAILVGPMGQRERWKNPTAPLDQAMWDELVADVRGLVDSGRVAFRWPSAEAEQWILREYLAAGGRFGKPRVRRRVVRERRALEEYEALFDTANSAGDLSSLATVLTRAAELESPTLRLTLEQSVLDRARRLGFSCPAGESQTRCARRLTDKYARPQQRLFNGLKKRLSR